MLFDESARLSNLYEPPMEPPRVISPLLADNDSDLDRVVSLLMMLLNSISPPDEDNERSSELKVTAPLIDIKPPVVMSPDKTVGPLVVKLFVNAKSALIVIIAVFPVLPTVKFANDGLILDAVKVNPLEKLASAGRIIIDPSPV